jgi:hypothetical protein
MKNNLIIVSSIVLLTSCNSQDASTQKINDAVNQVKQKTETAKPTNTGNSFLTTTVQEKAFTAINEVYATEITAGNYYAIGAQNDDFTVALQIPINKGIGSFTCDGSVVDNKTKKGFNAEAAAVTIEEKTETFIAGTFTMLAADADGNIQSATDGKFKALINKE